MVEVTAAGSSPCSLARAAGVWLHVDGAYGLPAAATEIAGHWFAGLDRADSVTIDVDRRIVDQLLLPAPAPVATYLPGEW